MTTTERYKKYIETKMRYLQLNIEMQRAKDELELLLLVGEAKGFGVKRSDAKEAFESLGKGFSIEKRQGIGTSIQYKDVSVFLHDFEVSERAFNFLVKAD